MRKLIPWTDQSRPPAWCLPMMEDDKASWWEFVLLGMCFGGSLVGFVAWVMS